MSEILVNTIKKADGTGSITVPAETGTVLTSASSIPVANLDSAVGITHMTQYKLDAVVSTVNDAVITNWELPDRNYNGIGTAVSVSSGLFSFPVTGTWLATSSYTTYSNAGGIVYMGFKHEFSTDSGSSFTTLAGDTLNSAHTTGAHQQGSVSMILHVSDISTYRFRIIVQTSDNTNGRINGSSTETRSNVVFTRLGDA